MSGHAETIRPTIRHDKMRVLNSWQHPSSCPGCAADVALDALLAENQRLRDALERLAEWPPESVEYSGETLRQFVMATRDMRAAAREALAGEDG